MLGGRGSGIQWSLLFFKLLYMVHCGFDKGSQNQHFLSTILAGREAVTKMVLCVRS